MKKIICIVIALVVLFVPSSVFASTTTINESYSLGNVKEIKQEYIDVLDNLMTTPVCCLVYREGKEYKDFIRPEVNIKSLINNYSGKALNDRFGDVISDIVSANVENPNVIWDKSFIENIVYQYCPEYKGKINSSEIVMESFYDEPKMMASRETSSGSKSEVAVVKCEALGNELYRMSCNVKWSWENNKLKSVKAIPSYKIKSARYSFVDYSHPVDISKDNFSAAIYVQGHFKESWTGGITFKHHYASLSMVVNRKGEFTFVPFTE